MSDFRIVISAILWAVIGLFTSQLRKYGLSSTEISALRWIFAAIMMFSVVALIDRNRLKIRIKDVWIFILSGVFALMFTSIFYFLSMEYTSVAVSDVLMYTSPIWVIILSKVVFKEKITPLKVLLILGVFYGCILVSGVFNYSVNEISVKGMLFGIASGITYGMYSVISKIALKKYSNTTFALYSFGFAAVGSMFTIEPTTFFSIISNERISLIYIIGMSSLSTVIPYLLYTSALLKVSPLRASVIACLEPVTASIISVFALHERISVSQIVGILLIIVMILFLQSSKGEYINAKG